MNNLHIGILSTLAIASITAVAYYYEYQRLFKSDESKDE
jgi:hypothetical protein